MLETQKLFVQRHIRELAKQSLQPVEILQKSLLIVNSPDITKKALQTFENSGSLTKTLHQLDIIQLGQPLLDAIESQEKTAAQGNTSFIAILDANETISESFNLLKIRLSIGLGYALWLSLLATTVFSIINIFVIPQFEDLFAGLGAELPGFTRLALDWNDSLFSPAVVGALLVFMVGFLLFSVNSLNRPKAINELLSKMPFVKQVINLTKDIRWLSHLRVLNSTSLNIDSCVEKLSGQPDRFKKYAPHMINQLRIAEKIGTLETEFDFQSHQLNQLAEKIVIKAARNLIAVIMVIVVSYVIFAIYASYLPIFQLGAVI